VFIDFASVSQPSAILGLISSSLGGAGRSDEALHEIGMLLGSREVLIILDTCEHVVGELARFVDAILDAAPNVRVLATGRQPMRARGESVFRLPSLAFPNEVVVTADEGRSYPAIELFLQRSRAAGTEYVFDDLEAPLLAEICCHLDGLPLAIEIAAARIGQFGTRDLLERLQQSVTVLDDDLPSGLPRHHTLRATLDWSYRLLSDDERTVFEATSVFRGPFTGEAVCSIAGLTGGSFATLEVIQSLCSKSLISSAILGGTIRYAMLDTNRAYAHGKLLESGQKSAVFCRLSEHLVKVLASREAGHAVEWPTAEELREALDWAFSDNGDIRLAISLTLHATSYWLAFSRLEECHAGVLRAIQALPEGDRTSSHTSMRLHAVLGTVLMNVEDPERSFGQVWKTVLNLAEFFDDAEYQARALWGLWIDCRAHGQQQSLQVAERFADLCTQKGLTSYRAAGARMMGISCFMMGRLENARSHLERALVLHPPQMTQHDISSFFL
jgi:predicted ATPase